MLMSKSLMEVADEAIKSVESEEAGVAGEAQDFMSLAEHDKRYHDGNYRGGPCLVRKQMASGDNSDAALEEANKREMALWCANRQERKLVEDAVIEGFKKLNTHNSRVMLSEEDKDGVSKLTIWCKAGQIKDEDVPEQQLIELLKGMGYDAKDYAVMIEQANSFNGRTKDKKCFVVDCKKKSAIKLAADRGGVDSGFQVRSMASDPLTDEAKNALLRKYGVKVGGAGGYQARSAEEMRRDRARRYLGITNDFEGQSNRDDVASGKWEKARLAALKRAQEARAAEVAAGTFEG